MKKHLTAASVMIGSLLMAGAISVAAQTSWSGPTQAPPNANVAAPINVGLNNQSKLGTLSLNTDPVNAYPTGLIVWGKTILKSVQVDDGTQGAGKVLTSDVNGNATWQTYNGYSPVVPTLTPFSSNTPFPGVISLDCNGACRWRFEGSNNVLKIGEGDNNGFFDTPGTLTFPAGVNLSGFVAKNCGGSTCDFSMVASGNAIEFYDAMSGSGGLNSIGKLDVSSVKAYGTITLRCVNVGSCLLRFSSHNNVLVGWSNNDKNVAQGAARADVSGNIVFTK